jgi:hypothetical protein
MRAVPASEHGQNHQACHTSDQLKGGQLHSQLGRPTRA